MDSEWVVELKRLYRQIPSFKCIKNCTDCCGPIFYTPLEASLFKRKYHPPNSIKCPFSVKGGCGIYEDRPMICRLFGAVNDPKLTCSFKCSPVFRLDVNQAYQLLIQVLRLSSEAGFSNQIFETHRAYLQSMVSPCKIPIKLSGYKFK